MSKLSLEDLGLDQEPAILHPNALPSLACRLDTLLRPCATARIRPKRVLTTLEAAYSAAGLDVPLSTTLSLLPTDSPGRQWDLVLDGPHPLLRSMHYAITNISCTMLARGDSALKIEKAVRTLARYAETADATRASGCLLRHATYGDSRYYLYNWREQLSCACGDDDWVCAEPWPPKD